MAVAVIAAATAIGAVEEHQSQTDALPLQGAADGLVMSHQPAAPPYTVMHGTLETEGPPVVGSLADSAGASSAPVGVQRGLLSGDLLRAPFETSNVGAYPPRIRSRGDGYHADLAPWQLSGNPGQFDYDLVYHPGETIEPTPTVVQAATVRAASFGGSLSEAEVIAVLREAGAPEEWIPPLLTIAFCESRWSPGAVGDGGNSLGMFQLWHGWARPMGYTPDDLFDPVKAAHTALYVREVRGRFGGGGGWTCADLRGIY